MMKQTMQNSIARHEDAARTGQPAVEVPSMPSAEREGLPLRTTVNRSPSGGGDITAEILVSELAVHGRIPNR